MFINSNRFTNFYRTHKTTIDTLLLLVQIIAIASALLGLLSIIGWAIAIEKAVTWLDNLVEDSLAKPHVYLLMPAKVSPPTVTISDADEILTEWHDRLGQVLDRKSIRQLKKMASDRHIPKYCNMTKGQLILALA